MRRSEHQARRTLRDRHGFGMGYGRLLELLLEAGKMYEVSCRRKPVGLGTKMSSCEWVPIQGEPSTLPWWEEYTNSHWV